LPFGALSNGPSPVMDGCSVNPAPCAICRIVPGAEGGLFLKNNHR